MTKRHAGATRGPARLGAALAGRVRAAPSPADSGSGGARDAAPRSLEAGRPRTEPVDPDVVEALRQLGYIE